MDVAELCRKAESGVKFVGGIRSLMNVEFALKCAIILYEGSLLFASMYGCETKVCWGGGGGDKILGLGRYRWITGGGCWE